MSDQPKCPYSVGDSVVYDPTEKGYFSDVMASPAGRLVRRKMYRIERIEKDFYVVVEGYSHPGGGIYWTEFRPNN